MKFLKKKKKKESKNIHPGARRKESVVGNTGSGTVAAAQFCQRWQPKYMGVSAHVGPKA